MDPMGQLRQYLRADEQLLWSGTPDASVWFAPQDAFAIPFSIAWCAFAIAFESAAVTSGPVIAKLWGIPFVAMGLYVVAGRFFYKASRKRRTTYAITTKRAMIVEPRGFADLPLRDQPVAIRRSRDGRHASVTFPGTLMPWSTTRRRRTYGYASTANTGMDLFSRSAPQQFAFYDVAGPDAMLRALDQARSQTSA
jgi:hypothetical protein